MVFETLGFHLTQVCSQHVLWENKSNVEPFSHNRYSCSARADDGNFKIKGDRRKSSNTCLPVHFASAHHSSVWRGRCSKHLRPVGFVEDPSIEEQIPQRCLWKTKAELWKVKRQGLGFESIWNVVLEESEKGSGCEKAFKHLAALRSLRGRIEKNSWT